jgi:hypothetical protein
VSTPNADYGRLIEAGKELFGWLESLSEDLGPDDGQTAVAVGDALIEWEEALKEVMT